MKFLRKIVRFLKDPEGDPEALSKTFIGMFDFHREFMRDLGTLDRDAMEAKYPYRKYLRTGKPDESYREWLEREWLERRE